MITLLLVLALGLAVGIISGMVGVAGGILTIPSLVFLFGLSQHKAQGITLGALLVPVGAFSFWHYWKAGNVDGKMALFLAVGLTIGGFCGAALAQQFSDALLHRIFGLLLLLVGLKMLLHS